jgi:hypothetical protein
VLDDNKELEQQQQYSQQQGEQCTQEQQRRQAQPRRSEALAFAAWLLVGACGQFLWGGFTVCTRYLQASACRETAVSLAPATLRPPCHQCLPALISKCSPCHALPKHDQPPGRAHARAGGGQPPRTPSSASVHGDVLEPASDDGRGRGQAAGPGGSLRPCSKGRAVCEAATHAPCTTAQPAHGVHGACDSELVAAKHRVPGLLRVHVHACACHAWAQAQGDGNACPPPPPPGAAACSHCGDGSSRQQSMTQQRRRGSSNPCKTPRPMGRRALKMWMLLSQSGAVRRPPGERKRTGSGCQPGCGRAWCRSASAPC